MDIKCSLKGCEKFIENSRKAGGVCNMHRHRFRRLGVYDLPESKPKKPGYLTNCVVHGKLGKSDIKTVKSRGRIFEYCKKCQNPKNPKIEVSKELTSRTCKKCNILKLKDCFAPSQWHLKYAYCFDCRKVWQDNSYNKKKSQPNYASESKNYFLSRKFKINLNKYNELLEKQNNVCAICLKPESRKVRGKICALSVDHCHKLEKNGIIKVRGLLCFACNSALGKFNDDIGSLQRAIFYLSSS